MFNTIRSPGERRISDVSLRRFLARNGFFPSEREIDAILRRLDHDNDQYLSYSEIREALGCTDSARPSKTLPPSGLHGTYNFRSAPAASPTGLGSTFQFQPHGSLNMTLLSPMGAGGFRRPYSPLERDLQYAREVRSVSPPRERGDIASEAPLQKYPSVETSPTHDFEFSSAKSRELKSPLETAHLRSTQDNLYKRGFRDCPPDESAPESAKEEEEEEEEMTEGQSPQQQEGFEEL